MTVKKAKSRSRSIGYGLANTAARVGGIIAPFAVNLDDLIVVSYIIIEALLFACAVLVLFIPETKDITLPESLYNLEIESQVLPNPSIKLDDSGKGSYASIPPNDSYSSKDTDEIGQTRKMLKVEDQMI